MTMFAEFYKFLKWLIGWSIEADFKRRKDAAAFLRYVSNLLRRLAAPDSDRGEVASARVELIEYSEQLPAAVAGVLGIEEASKLVTRLRDLTGIDVSEDRIHEAVGSLRALANRLDHSAVLGRWQGRAWLIVRVLLLAILLFLGYFIFL